MEGDIIRNHITVGIRKTHPITFMCLGVSNKDAFESAKAKLDREGE